MHTVVVFDRRRLIRDGVTALLAGLPDVECVPAAEAGPDAVAVVGEPEPGVALVQFGRVVRFDAHQPFATLVERIAAPPRDASRPANARGHRRDVTRPDRILLAAAGEGVSTREMAGRLGVSVRTVERRKQALFRRLGARSQAHAVAIAAERGLLTS